MEYGKDGFHFGIEAEYMLVDSVEWRPLWYRDLQFEHLCSVPGGFHCRPDALNCASGINEKRHAFHADDRAPAHQFFAPGAIGDGHCFVSIGQQGERQVVSLAELRMRP